MKRPELLAPAGNMEKLEVAVTFGADAVYLGGKRFGLRTAAASFDSATLVDAVSFAHKHGVKLFVTVNIFAHNKDLYEMAAYIKELEQIGVDGVIVADPGVIELVKEISPDLPVHLSTQANTTNYLSARFWEKQGIKRLVLARELSLQEIRQIKERVDLELEVFVHGAMCIAYSGRCLLSNYMTGRNANQGDCAQACRWSYSLVEEKRPGEFFPFYEDERGSYILSSKDLCLLQYIPHLIAAGVNSFKIEGRVKSSHYVATVTRVYREAIDACVADPANYQVRQEWIDEIEKVSNRDYITGFIDGPPKDFTSVEGGIYKRPYTFVGLARDYDDNLGVKIEQRNHFARNELIEVMPPGEKIFEFRIDRMLDEYGNDIEKAPHPCQTVYLPSLSRLPTYTMLRRRESQ